MMRRALMVGVLLAGGAVGCDSKGSSSATPKDTAPDKKTDVQIRTPGADVDVHGRKTGDDGHKSVDVDIHSKGGDKKAAEKK